VQAPADELGELIGKDGDEQMPIGADFLVVEDRAQPKLRLEAAKHRLDTLTETAVEEALIASPTAPILDCKALLELAKWLDQRHEPTGSDAVEPVARGAAPASHWRRDG